MRSVFEKGQTIVFTWTYQLVQIFITFSLTDASFIKQLTSKYAKKLS